MGGSGLQRLPLLSYSLSRIISTINTAHSRTYYRTLSFPQTLLPNLSNTILLLHGKDTTTRSFWKEQYPLQLPLRELVNTVSPP